MPRRLNRRKTVTARLAQRPGKVEAPPTKTVQALAGNIQRWSKTPFTDAGSAGSRLFEDQKQIWTSPFRLRLSDAEWLLPIAGITSAAILTDPSFSKALPNNPGTLHHFENIRNGSLAALGAASGGLYLWSLRTHDPHQRETGLLAGEAVIDSLIVTQGLQLAAGRERPLQGNGQGNFFAGGTSFPSNHSAAAWAAAGILAHEYHGPLVKLFAYGLASSVSIASVGSKQHFPSDVLIGSGLGWMISEYVYRTHHNAEVGGSAWNPFGEIFRDTDSGPAKYPGSPYVPVDSWVYRAFDRLAAFGLLSEAYQGKRPWSREQCAHYLVDIDEAFAKSGGSNPQVDSQVRALLQALHQEFAREEATFTGPNRSAEVDSVYTRVLSASGTVLNDGYHFGQTFAYDYGRPFREGTNLIDGASASATYGTLFFYIDGEYQHSPSQPGLSTAVQEFITERDKGPAPSGAPFAPHQSVCSAGRLCGRQLAGMADHIWKSKPLVGPRRRRLAAVEQQCRAVSDVASRSGKSRRNSWRLQSFGPVQHGKLYRAPGGPHRPISTMDLRPEDQPEAFSFAGICVQPHNHDQWHRRRSLHSRKFSGKPDRARQFQDQQRSR